MLPVILYVCAFYNFLRTTLEERLVPTVLFMIKSSSREWWVLNFTLWRHVTSVFRPLFFLSHDLIKIWELIFKSRIQLVLSCVDLSCLIIWIINVNSNHIFVTMICLDRNYLHRIYQGHIIVSILIPDKKLSASSRLKIIWRAVHFV